MPSSSTEEVDVLGKRKHKKVFKEREKSVVPPIVSKRRKTEKIIVFREAGAAKKIDVHFADEFKGSLAAVEKLKLNEQKKESPPCLEI